MYFKEILQFISLPVMIYVSYRLTLWLFKKLEREGKLK